MLFMGTLISCTCKMWCTIINGSIIFAQICHLDQRIMAPVAWRWKTGCPAPFKICQHGLWPVPAGQDQNLHQGPRICMYYAAVILDFEHVQFLWTHQRLQNDITLCGVFFKNIIQHMIHEKCAPLYCSPANVNFHSFNSAKMSRCGILVFYWLYVFKWYEFTGQSSTNLNLGTQRNAKLICLSVHFLCLTFSSVWM